MAGNLQSSRRAQEGVGQEKRRLLVVGAASKPDVVSHCVSGFEVSWCFEVLEVVVVKELLSMRVDATAETRKFYRSC